MFFCSRSRCVKWLLVFLIPFVLTSTCFARKSSVQAVHSVDKFVPETFMLSLDTSVSLIRGDGWNSWRGIPETVDATKILTISRMGRYCATATHDRQYPDHVFDLSTGESILQWDYSTDLVFSPDESCLVSVKNNTFTVHELPSGKVRWTKELKEIQSAFYFSGDSGCLVAMDSEERVGDGLIFKYQVYDAATGVYQRSFESKYGTRPAFSPDGKWCAVILPSGQATRVRFDDMEREPGFGQRASALAVGPESRKMAYFDDKAYTLVMKDMDSGKVLWTVEKIITAVQLDFSSSGRYLTMITGHDYGDKVPSMSIYDAHSGVVLDADTLSETRVPFMAVPLPEDRIAFVNGKTLLAYELDAVDPKAARKALETVDWENAEAVLAFFRYYHRTQPAKDVQAKVAETLVRDNTFALLVKGEKALSDAAARETVIKAIYGWVEKLKNIPGYVWFMERYPKYAKANKVLDTLHQRAFDLAADEDTIEAYNDFVIAYPHASLVKEAQDRAYELEKKKYTGWLSNAEKNARALLIKSKRMERQMNEIEKRSLRDGYYLVINRMNELLQDEFEEEEATLRYLESEEFKDFYKDFKKSQARIVRAINNLGGIIREQGRMIDGHFKDAAQSKKLSEEYTRQHRYWERYLKNL